VVHVIQIQTHSVLSCYEACCLSKPVRVLHEIPFCQVKAVLQCLQIGYLLNQNHRIMPLNTIIGYQYYHAVCILFEYVFRDIFNGQEEDYVVLKYRTNAWLSECSRTIYFFRVRYRIGCNIRSLKRLTIKHIKTLFD
jgi:hypothetical protein